MITGVVTGAREATVQLVIEGPSAATTLADAVIDTGFNGYLTVPRAMITALGLPSQGVRRATLGDGTPCTLNVYRATVLWDGQHRPVQALEAEGAVLIGMALLEGSRMTIDVRAGGAVIMEPLP